MLRNLRQRLRAAWHAFVHSGNPAFAVIYDFQQVDTYGRPTGDTDESFYEAFDTPAYAAEMFRTAYPQDMDFPPENPRLVLILDGIDTYRRPLTPETRVV